MDKLVICSMVMALACSFVNKAARSVDRTANCLLVNAAMTSVLSVLKASVSIAFKADVDKLATWISDRAATSSAEKRAKSAALSLAN